MPLTRFVRNVDDLSDDGGYKFRFKCDRCGDGVESQYVSSKSNLLKTAMDAFQVFRPFGFGTGRLSESLDRGLRGKERDAAYERAAHEVQLFFHKCTACGIRVCPEACWNKSVGLCETCAPDTQESAAKASALLSNRHAVSQVEAQKDFNQQVTRCGVCHTVSNGGKFCTGCGAPVKKEKCCVSCQSPVAFDARFCGQCGGAA